MYVNSQHNDVWFIIKQDKESNLIRLCGIMLQKNLSIACRDEVFLSMKAWIFSVLFILQNLLLKKHNLECINIF